MPDNPRIPGHPSDMPSSRSTEGSAHIPSSPGPGSNMPGDSSSSRSSPANNQTRNLIIGTIATIIASTSVYYLTQYVNNRKSSESTASYPEKKEATTNAWKRYVTMDNIYYKSVLLLSDDSMLLSNPDNYVEEISKEAAIFKKDAGKIAKEKNVDAAFKTMLTRRIERQTEFIELITSFVAKIKSIEKEKVDPDSKQKKVAAEYAVISNNVKRLYEKAATEIEDLSKTLAGTYAIPFDPYEVLIYADYKNGISGPGASTDETESEDSNNYAEDVDAEKLVGNWYDNGNKINLLKDKSFSYSLTIGEKVTGTWKLEDDKLRLDAVNSISKQKTVWLFNLKNITGNSFTMILSTKPYDTYNLVRVKAK